MENGQVSKARPNIRFNSKYLSLVLLLLGAGLIFLASARFIPEKIILEPSPSPFVAQRPQAHPVKIYIPRLARILPVSNGTVVNNRWEISETGVSYLTTSPLPGQIGNTVMYGHNKDEILGGLPRVQNGDLIYIVLDNGDVVKYQVLETKDVKPNQVEILKESSDARLTLYTCEGFLDQARFVAVGKLVEN